MRREREREREMINKEGMKEDKINPKLQKICVYECVFTWVDMYVYVYALTRTHTENTYI